MASTPVPYIEVSEGPFRIVGKSLTIRSLVVNGQDDLTEFVLRHDKGTTSDRRFLAKLIDYCQVVADDGEASSDRYFRRMRLWDGQWEIRIQQGPANHRFYGFLTEDRVFCVVRYVDKQWDKARGKDLRHVARVREAWLRIANER